MTTPPVPSAITLWLRIMPLLHERALNGCAVMPLMPAADAGDRVDLLDEADRATLAHRRVAQRLEVAADLAGGGAVHHRLERGRGDEQERDVGLGGHGPGEVGLAGAGRAFEEQAAARPAAHLVGVLAVGQEEVQRAHDFLADAVDADDVSRGERRSARGGTSGAASGP